MLTNKMIKDIVWEMDCISEDSYAFFHRQTGEVYCFPDDEVSALANDAEADLDSLSDWMQEEVLRIREIEREDDWVPLPDSFTIHEWAIMRDFMYSLPPGELQDELNVAIHGKGAFRMFNDALHRHSLFEQWNPFKYAAYEKILLNWLDDRDIPYEKSEPEN